MEFEKSVNKLERVVGYLFHIGSLDKMKHGMGLGMNLFRTRHQKRYLHILKVMTISY